MPDTLTTLCMLGLLACYLIANEMDYREEQRQAAEAAARRVAVRIVDPDEPSAPPDVLTPDH